MAPRPAPDTPKTKRAKAAREKFVADLIVRDDAAPRGADGKVPRHATHEVTRNAKGQRGVRRVRFKVV
jgi:hypothetical protein